MSCDRPTPSSFFPVGPQLLDQFRVNLPQSTLHHVIVMQPSKYYVQISNYIYCGYVPSAFIKVSVKMIFFTHSANSYRYTVTGIQLPVYSYRYAVTGIQLTVYSYRYTANGIQLPVYSYQYTVTGMQLTVYS